MIFGASGAGSTTLARELARLINFTHHDTDDYFWEATNPPFTKQRSHDERTALLEASVKSDFVLSGCIREWGSAIEPMLKLAVFNKTTTDVRLKRLQQREHERHGTRIMPGGDLHASNIEFMEYVATYDTGGLDTRSLASQKAWAETLACPVVEINGADDYRENAVGLVEIIKTLKILQ